MDKKISELIDAKDNKANSFVRHMTDMSLKTEAQLVGLLYYNLRHKNLTFDEIKEKYNESIIASIEVLQKLDSINYESQDEEAENLRKMFFAITKDIRIIMIKLAYAITELEFPESETKTYKQALAKSIFTIYAPLAARLGLSSVKSTLEDGAFKIENPKKYDEIEKNVDNLYHEREPIVDKLVKLVESCMKEAGISGRVYGRKKHIYSIYKKIQDKPMEGIYDLVAVRAILNNVSDCYELLGRLHSKVEPLQKRFKDYISIPKSNGYQSLHTTVILDGLPVEVQIRTEEMHKYAEYGIAAHWMYKEKRSKQDSLDVHLAWLRNMLEKDDVSLDDIASSLSQDIYNDEIFVQSPKGKVVYLPKHSTPIDFAYIIHSEVGNKCVGAKVNGKMVPTTSTLKNGDVVEIITNPNSKGPSRDWLKICQTQEAKSKINAFFKKNMKEENVHNGKAILDAAIKDKGYSVSKLTNKKSLEEVLAYFNFDEVDELYANIGTGAISTSQIINKLTVSYQKQIKEDTENTATSAISISEPTEKQVKIKGLNNILTRFAKCCHPMYGDDIVGFVSAGRGVIIHRAICPNISYFSSNRLIECSWNPKEDKPINKKKK